MARGRLYRRPPQASAGPVTLTPPQLCEAARRLAQIEGWQPDTITCQGRPIWQRYAEEIEQKYLPAINKALQP